MPASPPCPRPSFRLLCSLGSEREQTLGVRLCRVLKARLPVLSTPSVFQGIFIKDSNSLAYYNMANGAVIHLALKERGGRKK